VNKLKEATSIRMWGVENATTYLIFLLNSMTVTLLFDLDDTLIRNSMETFVPAYSQALAMRLAPSRPGELIQHLMFATGAMVQNMDPNCTLEQSFDRVFYPGLQLKREDVQPEIDFFYNHDFPMLSRIIEAIPTAVQIVDTIILRGWKIALATNPLFPQTAVRQRLDWANLSCEKYPWLIVPSYESFHFAKPHPEFYAELLGQIGWPEDAIVMVGNDLEMDILPAKEFGLATYWVDNHASTANFPSERHGQGKLTELITWLDQSGIDQRMIVHPSSRSLLAALRSTTAALATLTRGLGPEDWKRKTSPQEWCLTEIICHLRDVEAEVNLPRIGRFLKESDPFITGKNTDIWAKERKYIEQDGPQALNSLAQSRTQMVAMLENLTDRQWNLSGRHSIFGPIQLSELVNITASHDKLHLQTIFELVGGHRCLEY
jgi:FMN phosphatase YigB (HAD superfamily)